MGYGGLVKAFHRNPYGHVARPTSRPPRQGSAEIVEKKVGRRTLVCREKESIGVEEGLSATSNEPEMEKANSAGKYAGKLYIWC